MTLKEAQTVAEILASTHGGCADCGKDSVSHFFRRFPDVDREAVLEYLVKEGCMTEESAKKVRRLEMLK